jgi:hypothetical protein
MVSVLSFGARGFSFDCSAKIIPEKSLLITDLAVVNSQRAQPLGSFGFSGLLKRGLVNSDYAGEAVYDWLMQYKRITTFNGYRLPERRPKPLLDLWPFAPYSSNHRQDPALDLGKAPLNLLAIAFRPDLASANSFGEARFLFGVVDQVGLPRDMTVILEFSLHRSNLFPTKKAWFQAIANLSHASDERDYLRQLERLTEEATYPFSGHTRLAKLRTNDQFFGQGWDLREFVVDEQKNNLRINTVEKTPDFSLNGTKQSELISWIKGNAAEIMKDNYSLPKEFGSGSAFFLDNEFRWLQDNSEIDEDLRHHFAENTCSGCHGAETATEFFHVHPRRPDERSVISDYLAGNLHGRAELLKSELCD